MFDFKVLRAMESRTEVLRFSAYRTPDDLAGKRKPITSLMEAGEARYYHVSFFMPTLSGPGKFIDRTDVQFDLSNPQYPFAEPIAWVLSNPKPWSPHFHPGGSICTGDVWQKDGHMLLAHLALHVARLLNFDEVPREAGYVGYNGAAIAYWRTTMKLGRVTPDLKYPPLPSDLLFDLSPPAKPVFVAKAGVSAPSTALFARKAGG